MQPDLTKYKSCATACCTGLIVNMGCQVGCKCWRRTHYCTIRSTTCMEHMCLPRPFTAFIKVSLPIHHDFCPAFIKVSVPPSSRFLPYFAQSMFSSPRETCSLFQWKGEVFLVFSFKPNIVHLHFTISDAAKQIGVVAVYQVGEINNLIRFLIAKGVKMGRKHHRHVHLVEFGHQSLLQMIRAVPLL